MKASIGESQLSGYVLGIRQQDNLSSARDTVMINWLLPLVRMFIALSTDIAITPRLRFHVYAFVGSSLSCFGLAYLRGVLGERWQGSPGLHETMHRLDVIVVLGLLGLTTWWIWRHRHQRLGIRS